VKGVNMPTASRVGGGVDWDAAYERYAEELARFVVKLLGDRERAADLVHDAFIRAMKGGTQLRDPNALRPWLFRIAGNLARNELRRRGLFAFVPFVGTERGHDDAFDVEASQIHRALASIAPEQAVALVLHYQQGFSRAEIAVMTGVSEEGVKSRLARGRAGFIAAYGRLERGHPR
jgi:RNA polymerase sigma-70 factor (ECF subfamily)